MATQQQAAARTNRALRPPAWIGRTNTPVMDGAQSAAPGESTRGRNQFGALGGGTVNMSDASIPGWQEPMQNTGRTDRRVLDDDYETGGTVVNAGNMLPGGGDPAYTPALPKPAWFRSTPRPPAYAGAYNANSLKGVQGGKVDWAGSAPVPGHIRRITERVSPGDEGMVQVMPDGSVMPMGDMGDMPANPTPIAAPTPIRPPAFAANPAYYGYGYQPSRRGFGSNYGGNWGGGDGGYSSYPAFLDQGLYSWKTGM